MRISQYFLSCWSRGRVASRPNRKVQVVFWTVCLHFRKCLVVHRSLSVQKGTHCSCLTTFLWVFTFQYEKLCYRRRTARRDPVKILSTAVQLFIYLNSFIYLLIYLLPYLFIDLLVNVFFIIHNLLFYYC